MAFIPASDSPTTPTARIRAIQIVLGALAMGLISFATLAAVLGNVSHASAPTATPVGSTSGGADLRAVLLMMVAGLSVVSIIAGTILNRLLRKRARTGEPTQALGAYATRSILLGALAEGPALLACVSVLTTGERLFLVVPAIALAVFAVLFPSASRFESFAGLTKNPYETPKN
jgi:hypothetical protein